MINVNLKSLTKDSIPSVYKHPSQRSCLFYLLFDSNLDDAISFYGKDPVIGRILREHIESKIFTGKAGEWCNIPLHNQSNSSYHVFLGMGPFSKDFNIDVLRQNCGKIGRFLRENHLSNVSIFYNQDIASIVSEIGVIQGITEGALLGDYVFDNYKQKPKRRDLITCDIYVSRCAETEKYALRCAQSLAKFTNMARDLANMPANHLTPKNFVSFAKDQVSSYSRVSLSCITQEEAKELNMNAFLAVAQGSEQSPQFLILELNKSEQQPVVLVGKGVTFDSGGLSIKSAKGMDEMKADMTGAAVVLASLLSLADQGSNQHVVALIPLVENMPSAAAQRPGDIITAMNGMSIEVINTDAEGRLIMADAICYANKFYSPKVIVDVATLTGAALVALGDVATAVFSNDTSQEDAFKAAAKRVGECVWSLPVFDAFRAYIDSDVADIKNSNENRLAGASTAAIFLKEFVAKTPWIHLDIAPTMQCSKTKGARIKGMQAPCVNALVDYITHM